MALTYLDYKQAVYDHLPENYDMQFDDQIAKAYRDGISSEDLAIELLAQEITVTLIKNPLLAILKGLHWFLNEAKHNGTRKKIQPESKNKSSYC